MTDLAVRRLLIDLQTPFARHWCHGDAFLSAFFNALSMSFPTGEQFFIDAVRDSAGKLPPEEQAARQAEVRSFIGQEATHRRIHARFNAPLERHGLVTAWGPRGQARMQLMAGAGARHALAITAATEHFTAIFAEWMLRHPNLMGGAQARPRSLGLWHSAEEAEHTSTALDLYQALCGNHAWPLLWFKRISSVSLGGLWRPTVDNLRRDGTLWQWRTWRSAARHLLGRNGLLRETWRPWRAYFEPGFHPGQNDSAMSAGWLRANAAQCTLVGRN